MWNRAKLPKRSRGIPGGDRERVIDGLIIPSQRVFPGLAMESTIGVRLF